MYTNQNKVIPSLQNKISVLYNELDKVKTKVNIHASWSTCNKCASIETKIVELYQIIDKHEKGKHGLSSVLSIQRYTYHWSGLGYSKFEKLSQIKKKIVLIKSTNIYKNVQTINRLKIIFYQKWIMLKILFIPVRRICITTCLYFYCNCKGHTLNTHYTRKYGVPSVKYIWVENGNKNQGHKPHWGPNKF